MMHKGITHNKCLKLILFVLIIALLLGFCSAVVLSGKDAVTAEAFLGKDSFFTLGDEPQLNNSPSEVADKEVFAYFYQDREFDDNGEKITPTFVVDASSDNWQVPSAKPVKDGYTFKGWTNKSPFGGYLQVGQKVTKLEENTNYFAVWESADKYEKKDSPMFTQTEKHILIAAFAVVLLIILFVYYWFAVKKLSFKDLFRRRRK